MESETTRKSVCYDMKDLYRILPIGKNKLHELVHSNGFPALTVGRRILVPKKAFEEWLENAAADQIVI